MKWWNRWLTDDKRANRTAPLIEELEPRVLLSADAAGVFVPDPGSLQQQTPTELLLDDNLEPAPTQQVVQEESRSLELVFVDTDSPDYQSIVDSLTNSSDQSRQFEVIVLDNNRDGVWQISQALQNYSDVDAIHLVSHGDSSGIDLGNTRLDSDSLQVQQDQFLAWSNYLSADADILIYGCNLASSDAGVSLMQGLAATTGADIAASEDLTGHASLGGNWLLEVRVGEVETGVFASRGLLENFRATLAAPTANDDNGGYSQTVSDQDPDAYFRLGDDSDIADETATGNTGTANGGVTTNTGGATADSDNSLAFDGSNDYVHIPHSSAYELDDGSISLWFNSTTISDGDALFSKDRSGTAEGGHLTIQFTGNGADAEVEVRLQRNGTPDSYYLTSTTTSGYLNDGSWHNVVFTFGANGMELYIDGQLEATDTYTGGLRGDGDDTPNSEPIALGASRRSSTDANPSGGYFQGSLDEFAIVNEQLSAADVLALYNNASVSPSPAYVVEEGDTLTVSAADGVLFNDDDGGESTTVTVLSSPGNASAFTLNSDGSFEYTPNTGFTGTDTFTYTATNASGSDTATVTVYVEPSPPELRTIDTADLDDDGYIDALHITFDRAIDDSTVTADDWTIAGVSVEPFSSTTNGDTANDSDIYIEFTDGVLDAAATPLVSYAQDNPTDADLAGLASGTALEDTDGEAWWNQAWLNRVKINFDTSAIANLNATEDLVDFPVLIELSANEVDFDLIKAGGEDIRFVDPGGTELDFEIASWDDTSETASIWVRLPQLDEGSTSDFIHIYYNNADATSAENATGVWDADFTGVWHLDETSGTNYSDSTANANHGSASAVDGEVPTAAGGQVLNGQDFDGSDDIITVPTNAGLNNTGSEVTLEAWVRTNVDPDTGGGDQWYDIAGIDGKISIYLGEGKVAGTTELMAEIRHSESNDDIWQHPDANIDIVEGDWAHIAITFDGKDAKGYVNGVLDWTEELHAAGGATLDDRPGDDFVIGDWKSPAVDPMNGLIDEVRYSSTARSADWIAASYAAQNGSLVSFGRQEATSADAVAPAAPVITGISDDTLTPGDGMTTDNTLVITGTAEANSSIELFIDGGSIGTTTANGSGDWSYDHTGTTLSDGSYTLTARATDAAGNTGATSAGYDITVDTTVLDITSIETRDLDSDGFIDAIDVTFNEAVDDGTVTANDFSIGGSAGTSFSTGAGVDDNQITISFADGLFDTGVTPEVTYTQDDPSDPDLTDLNSIPMADRSISPSWWDSGWQHRTEITFDNSNSAENLVDFPVLITLDGATIDFNQIQADGADIRFVDSDGTELDYEIESWDDGLETARIWVRVGQLDAGSTTDFIHIYYDNPNAADNQNAAGVWDTNYGAVYHLNEPVTDEASTADAHIDSAGSNHGDQSGNAPATGVIDDGQAFDGLNDRISIGNVIGTSTSATFSGWIKHNSLTNTVERYGDLGNNFVLRHDGANSVGQLHFYVRIGGVSEHIRVNGALSDDTWYHVAGTWDGTNQRLYLNGTEVGSNTAVGTLDTPASGQLSAVSETFNGTMDEVRFSTTARSADWIEASYLSQNGSFAFTSFGLQETGTTDTAVPVVSITRDDANNTNASSVTFSVDFSEDVSNVTADDFSVAVTGTAAASVYDVTDAGDADDSTYTVTVNSISGDGTVGLDIAGGNNIVDAANNPVDTTPTADEVYTVDNTAPAAPAVTAISDDTGAADGVTTDNTLVITGNAEANSSVEVFIDGASIGTTTANGTGAWSYDHAGTTLEDGSYTLTAEATDAAGNVSVTSAGFNVTVDTSGPKVVSIDTQDLNNDGFIDALHITFDEPVLDSTVNADDFDVAGAAGESFSSTTNGDTANDSDIYITFNDGVLGTGIKPGLSYTTDSPTDADIADALGNAMADLDGSSAWWNESWLNRTKITFDNSNSAENLTDFPVLLRLTADDIDFSQVKAGGADIRLVDSDGTELDYEIESWDDGTETATVWVRVGQIDAGSTTDFIHVYYNNSAATDNQNPEGVWDSNYLAVHHLNETSGAHLDSTSNNHDSLAVDVATQGSATGIIGGANDHDGTNQGVDLGNAASLAPSSITVSVWAKREGLGDGVSFQDLLGRQDWSNSGYLLVLQSETNSAAWRVIESGANTTISAGGITTSDWNLYTGTFSGTTSELYVNGVLMASSGSAGMDSGTGSSTAIGNDASGDTQGRFDGLLDEARISDVARSADWIEASYLSQNGSFAFTSFGARETVTTDAANPVASITRDDSTPTGATSVTFSVDFSEDVSNVTADDFSVAVTGTAAATTITVDNAGDADDSTYAVTVSGISGDGTVGLDINGSNNIVDAAGNALDNTPTVDEVYTVDNTAPAAPSFALAADTGANAVDGITNDATVNVTLAGDAASWEYSLDGGSNYTTGTGTSFELADNTNYAIGDIVVRQTDTAGNQSATSSNTAAITTDMSVVALSFALAADTGASAVDGITNDATVNVTLAGDAASWEYSLDGGSNYTTGTGTSFELADNTSYAIGDIVVRQTDTAGNQSATASNTAAITTDMTVPAAPSVTVITEDTGAADTITADTNLVFNGTAEANSSVEVFLDGSSIGITTADAGGDWSFDHTGSTLTDGSYMLTSQATDEAGNVGSMSGGFTFTVDTSTPVAAISGFSTDTGTADGITSDNQLVFSGSASAGSSVEVFLNGSSIGTTTADGAGNWSFDHTGTTLTDAGYTVTVQATNPATGLAGAVSAGLNVTIDTVAPTATVTGISPDTGAIDNVTFANRLNFNGVAEANNIVEVFLDSGGGPVSLGVVAADGAGSWTIDYTSTSLADDSYTLFARATDPTTGTTGALSGGLVFTIDTPPPPNATPSGEVSIDNTNPAQGDFLIASNTLFDSDGMGTITYHWQRDTGSGFADIGATGDTYTATQEDVGATIRVEARYTDLRGFDEAVASGQTAAVANVDDAGTGDVSIDNLNPAQGDTLTASNTLDDPDGLSGTIFYQWQRDGADVPGQNGTIYVTTQADVGAVISVVASYLDDLGGTGEFASVSTAPVADINDEVSGTVVIEGSATEDQTLTVTSSLSDPDGVGEVSYQWQRDGVDINGATGDSYTLGQQDVGAQITVVASYVDGSANAETIASGSTAPVSNVNDAPSGNLLSAPADTDTGTVLTVNNNIFDEDGISGQVRFQWMRNGVAIAGATGDTYTLTEQDMGSTVSVRASYTDDFGVEEMLESTGIATAESEPEDAPVDDNPTDPTSEDLSGNDNSDVPSGVNVPSDSGTDDSGAPTPVVTPPVEDPTAAPPATDFEDSVLDSDIGTDPILDLDDEVEIGNRSGNGVVSVIENESSESADEAETGVAIAEAERDKELIEDLLQLIQDADAEDENNVVAATAGSVSLSEELASDEDLSVVQDVLTNHALWDAIDRMNEEMAKQSAQKLTREELVVQFVSTSGLGLFAAITVYALRGGALMASWLSTMPLWGNLDPLPVVRNKKDEEKEQEEKKPRQKGSRELETESLFGRQERA